MSSFLFEKEEINCNCFDSSPKNARRIFRTESYHTNKLNPKENTENSFRNTSESAKQKKKSLKKEKQLSNLGSEKDNKEKEETHTHIHIPDVETPFSSNQPKKEQKPFVYEQHYDQSHLMPIKLERSKQIHNWRAPKQHVLFEPLEFEFSQKRQLEILPAQFSERKINAEEYDKKISEEFENDLKEFKLLMEKNEDKNVQPKHSIKKRKNSNLLIKEQFEQLNLNEPSSEINYSATEHIIPSFDQDKSASRAITFRNSVVSNKEKVSIKKEKHKILPKEIESQRDSNSETESDRLSEVVGRGWEGLTEKRISFYEAEEFDKREKTRNETMATQESHIKSSQGKTFTEFSNIMTSPKSMINKGMAFGGGHKYGLTGLSFQQLESMRTGKGSLSTKKIL